LLLLFKREIRLGSMTYLGFFPELAYGSLELFVDEDLHVKNLDLTADSRTLDVVVSTDVDLLEQIIVMVSDGSTLSLNQT